MSLALHRSTRRVMWVGVGSGLLILGTLFVLAYRRADLLRDLPELMDRRHRLEAARDGISKAVADAEAAQRGYMLTGDVHFLEDEHEAESVLEAQMASLELALADVPETREGFAAVQQQARRRLVLLAEGVSARDSAGLPAATSRLRADGEHGVRDSLEEALAHAVAGADGHLAAREARLRSAVRGATALILVAGGLAGLVILAGALVIDRDFRRRVVAARALAESERRLRMITESLQGAVFAFDFSQRMLFVNPAFERLTGHSTGALAGRPLIDFCHPDDRTTMAPLWQRAAEGETTAGGAFRILAPGGGHRWCTSSWGPLLDPTGARVGVLGTILDVSDLKASEEDLRRDTRLLAAIVDTQQRIATTRLEPQAVMEIIVERAQALTGARGAGVALVEEDVLVFHAAGGIVAGYVGLRLSLHGSLSGRAVTSRRIMRSDDTETDPLVDREATRRVGVRSLLAVPLLDGAEPIGVLTVVSPDPHSFTEQDTHVLQLIAGFMAASVSHASAYEDKERRLEKSSAALRESEDRFRNIVETAQEGICLLDELGTCRYANRRMAALVGCTTDAVLGRPIYEFLDVASRPAAEAHLAGPGFATGGTMPEDLRFRSIDGTERWAIVSTSPVRGPAGEFVATLAMVTDVTERRKVEDRLHRYADRLTALRDIEQAILGEESPEAIAAASLAHLRELVPCERSDLVLFDFDAGEGIVAAGVGDHPSLPRPGDRVALLDLSPLATLGQGPVRYTPDLDAVTPSHPMFERLRSAGLRSVLTVPLVVGDELIGEVNLGSARRSAFTPEHEEISAELASALAIAIRQAWLRQDLRRRADDVALQLSEQRRRVEELVAALSGFPDRPAAPRGAG